MSEETVVNVAAKSASFNIVLQVLMRVVSSLSNAFIIRFISKDALGVINVRLLLLYSTAHCFSREAFRRSCLSKFNNKNTTKIFNLLWLTFPTCIICSFLLRLVWLHFLEKPDPNTVPNYAIGVSVVVFSVLIEILAEPVFVFSQSFHFVKLKVIIEGLSITAKNLSMVLLLIKWPQHVIYIFCFSQLLGSILYTLSYYLYFWSYLKENRLSGRLPIDSICDILPRLSKQFVDWEDFHLTWSFFKQTLLKQLLTEGERYLMTFFNVLSFAEQGLYDVVNNLGSLAARFIFLPIEESGYLLFSQLIMRDQPTNVQRNIGICLAVLENLLKMMVLIGLIILAFGYSYSKLLLLLYGGSVLSSGIALTLLRWHCFYVLLLAINGVTECFKFAAMNHHQIDRYNKKMVLLSAGFLLAAYCLATLFDGVGFILANCLNMAFRIVHSVIFIQNYFKLPKFWFFQNVVPQCSVLGLLLAIFCLTSMSEAYLCCDLGIRVWVWHFLIGAVCFVFLLFTIWCKERTLIAFIQEQWRHKKKKQ